MSLPEPLDTALRTVAAVALLPFVVAGYSGAAIARALTGASASRVHALYVGFSRVCLAVGGTRLLVRGREWLKPGAAYVVVSNHESSWDPPCLIAGLPELAIRFVVKDELMRIPVFGHALRATGNVRVMRTRTEDDAQRIREKMDRRDPAVSVLFFAEGTRSREGALQPFKMGAFATALGYRLPVLPVAVAGTYPIWPKATLRLRRGTVAVEVGEPIPTGEIAYADRAALRERTHAAVANLRARARARLRELGCEPGGVD